MENIVMVEVVKCNSYIESTLIIQFFKINDLLYILEIFDYQLSIKTTIILYKDNL